MYLEDLSRVIKDNQLSGVTVASRVGMRTHSAASMIRPKCLVVQVQLWVNLVEDQARLWRLKPIPGYHLHKDNLKANKAMVGTWVRCTIKVDLSMEVDLAAWGVIINTVARTIKLLATEATALGMGLAIMAAIIVVDGAPIMDTDFISS